MDPVHGVESVGTDEARMLEVALEPAPVALGEVDDRRRALLVVALDSRSEPDLPAGPSHQRRLDEVMAQDAPAEGPASRELGQGAVPDERRQADDGVVPPVVGLAQLPVVEPRRGYRAVEPARELLEARENGLPIRQERHALDDPDAVVALHQLHHAQDRLAGHDAVGIEDQHVPVQLAPPAAEVRDVAGLLVDSLAPLSVEDSALGAELKREREPGGLLRDPAV